jgi:hypothetical protein
VKVSVSVGGSIVIDDDVHPLNVNAATEDIGGHENTLFESFERGVSADTKWNCQVSSLKMEGESDVPFLLGKTRMDTDTRKIARNEQFIQLDRACDGFHKDDDLFNGVEQ